ncbi:TRAP transporter small permease [Meridianimarinicoccus sp. RP-17]|uniref:TRAP transporter small permease n=1 Tax=Meridianimarinicoccus zhengii TaxID=2056810 RepID=UPI000DAD3C69|nr:TRAP transporter small permease subunit [Phycocomes zhengii]
MAILLGLIAPLQALNTTLGRLGHWATVIAMALMVTVIVLQVVFRYVLNNALPWPDEAARFFMLWMTGLIAPVAYRRGGFVAIDMLVRALPARIGAALAFVLLLVAMLVLIKGIQLGHAHTMSGCLFRSGSLWLPFSVQFALPVPGSGMSLTLCTAADFALGVTWGWAKLPLATMYASLFLGFVLLTLVNLELILRALVSMLGGAQDLKPIPGGVVGAE